MGGKFQMLKGFSELLFSSWKKKLNLQKQNKIEDNVIFIQYILTWHF